MDECISAYLPCLDADEQSPPSMSNPNYYKLPLLPSPFQNLTNKIEPRIH